MTFILGCDPTDDRLKILNSTNREIFYSIAKSDSFAKSPLFIVHKDTVWESCNIVLPNSTFNHALIGPNEWEYFINRDCEDSTLRVFFFTKELIIKSSWDSLVRNQVYSKKITATVNELNYLDWKIMYE
jgi:hypothetical protein